MKLLKKKLLFCFFSRQTEAGSPYCRYQHLYFRTSEFKPVSVRSAVNELIEEGLIDRLRRNRQALFRLTASGRQVVQQQLPYLVRLKPWDHIWRIVILTGALGQALRPLQRQLSLLGYRHYSRGIYINPRNVAKETRQILIDNHWLKQVMLIESRRLEGADDQQLAVRLWPLEGISREYDHFISLADRLLKISRRNLILLQQAKFGFKDVFDAYFSLLIKEPALPGALLPSNWPAAEAADLFWRLVELANTAKI